MDQESFHKADRNCYGLGTRLPLKIQKEETEGEVAAYSGRGPSTTPEAANKRSPNKGKKKVERIRGITPHTAINLSCFGIISCNQNGVSTLNDTSPIGARRSS